MPRETRQARGDFSGAIVALLPSLQDAARLAVEGFEPPGSLHVTLAWLGDTEDGPEPEQPFDEAVEAVWFATQGLEPVEAEVFAHAVFNPVSDERDPATVPARTIERTRRRP